ncbi:hypothetical protein JHK85_007001 [Glycine max]|nr:hypothetical protein JHK85_007001 [Glycine max]
MGGSYDDAFAEGKIKERKVLPKKNQQIEDSLLEAWLDDDELLGSEINVISLTPSDFWASSSQNERLDGDVFYEEIEGATIGDSEANKRIKMHKFRRIFQGLAAKSITMPVNSVEEVPTFPRSPLGGSIGPTSTLGETIEVF